MQIINITHGYKDDQTHRSKVEISVQAFSGCGYLREQDDVNEYRFLGVAQSNRKTGSKYASRPDYVSYNGQIILSLLTRHAYSTRNVNTCFSSEGISHCRDFFFFSLLYICCSVHPRVAGRTLHVMTGKLEVSKVCVCVFFFFFFFHFWNDFLSFLVSSCHSVYICQVREKRIRSGKGNTLDRFDQIRP